MSATSPQPSTSHRVDEPWFRRRPVLTVVASAVMYLGVFLMRLATGNADDALLVLLAFPISLLAIAFGMRAGILSGLLGIGLIGAWVWISADDLSTLGWLARVGPLLFLGFVLGDASDRLDRAAEEREALGLAKSRHQQAIEVNDSLIQGMAAAKWALEAHRYDTAASTLEQTISAGQRLVSEALRDEGMGPVPGDAGRYGPP